MALLRASREHRGPDPYYHFKAILFSVGGGIGLLAIATGWDWLVWPAVVVLVIGVSLRWFGRRGNPPPPAEDATPPPDDPPRD